MRISPTVQLQPELRGVTPLELAARWPAEQRLQMLHSGRVHPRWARWSIMASPRATWRFDCRSHWIGSTLSLPGAAQHPRFTNDPLTDLDALLNATRIDCSDPSHAHLPFRGGWVGYFSYDLGRVIESRAQHTPSHANDRAWPLIELSWCPDALLFDHVEKQWHAVGDVKSLFAGCETAGETESPHDRFAIDELRPTIHAEQYKSMVTRTIEYIAAGDIFQANIAQRFATRYHGSARDLMIQAMRTNQPWYGAHLELAATNAEPARSIVSLSPELFLHVDPATRCVITRPIKGTRPTTRAARELIDSAKDAAELHMIVDLMRNDLGRVCEFGSVDVPSARTIETHPTVHHGVGEVTGTLRADITIGQLLRATFPGGSVTGAPKIRAMQIIDELEAEPRGPYCGAIGCISDCGAVSLNIAIRTMLLERPPRTGASDTDGRGELQYWAGAGIVADSDPDSEYRECLDKAAVVRSLVRPHAGKIAVRTA